MDHDSHLPLEADSLHWRARMGHRRTTHFEQLAELLLDAMVGTFLAGAAFPTVLAIVAIVTRPAGPGEAVVMLLASIAVLGIVGGVIAFTVSVPVVLVAAVVGRLMGVTDRDIWFASLVGAWSGYFASHLVFGGTPLGGFFALVASAVATGQIGAGAYAYRAYAKSNRGADRSDDVRFGLKQLFGATTAVALLAAFARVLSERGEFIAETALMAIGLQAAIIGLGVAANSHLRRVRAADAVSRGAA